MERELERSYQTQHRDVRRVAVTLQLDALVHQMKDNANASPSGILVSGHRGTGKTWLVENYLQNVEPDHPVLVARHYSQHQNIPYFGFKYCISDYLGKIYNQSDKTQLRKFSEKLTEYLGESIFLLIDYIPELSLILGQEAPNTNPSKLTIENQLYPLFRRIFEFLSGYHGCPVYFFTDDLQWIDASGINLLKYLLLSLTNQQLIWIAACRTPQNKISLHGQLFEELRLKEIRIENIALKGLTRKEVDQFAEMILGAKCGPELVDTCYKLTGGNPSHLLALLESLKNSDLVWREGDVFQCDSGLVIAQYEGQKAQTMLLEQVKRLSDRTYTILCMTACMGRFDRQLILDWLKGDTVQMKTFLEEAIDAGLLKVYDQEVRFSEMHIGEMIYDQLTEDRKADLHYMIADLYHSRDVERLNSTDIIMMATSFNQSLDRVKAGDRLQLAAGLNYRAGKILQQDKAYDQARYFFKMSAEMLKECR